MSAASVIAVLAVVPAEAVAASLTISSDLSAAWQVYGNSVTGLPDTLDTSASPSDNSVTLEDPGVVGRLSGGYSSAADQNAERNSVVVTGGTVTDSVSGGSSDTTDALSNTVVISGGQVASVFGGRVSSGSANNNTVTINGGTVSYVCGGSAGGGDANYNSVVITGGMIDGSVEVGAGRGASTGNTLTISGDPVFSPDVTIRGGKGNGEFGSAFSDNTFNLKTDGLTIDVLQNFQYLNFYLPTTLAAGDTMLTVNDLADLTGDHGSVSSVINVGIDGASSALAAGDSVTLIHAGTLSYNAGLNGTATGVGMQGVTLSYVFDITATSTDLIATVQGSRVTDESKALSEGFVSGASLVNEGADLAAGKGMANAIGGAGADWSPFAAVSGGSIRTNTGSHVDVDGVSLVAGLSRGVDLSIGRLTAGAFAEFGSGNYDTFNGFASGDVRGHGNSHYVGGGLLGHQDFRPMGPGHAYAEGSARIGVANNNYSSADLTSGGVAAGYETSSLYYGVSAAVGYVWTLSDAMTVDVSGKYLWSRLGSDSAQLTTGETVDFEAVNSERTRLGARVSYALSNKVTPYAGAAWEHEFDGKARASTNGFAIDAPSMAGDTGIFEAGLTLKPSDDLPLSIDLGIQGFVGQREGIAGSFQAKLAF